jgi:single-strand DNA-binding protein
LIIIGNLTRDPELRTTQSGINVCTFTVAVNRRKQQQDSQPEADFFRVTAWRELGVNCGKFLQKGKKVCVIGPVSLNTYTGQDGATHANLEVMAQDVEFLTPRVSDPEPVADPAPAVDQETGFSKLEVETDDLPF